MKAPVTRGRAPLALATATRIGVHFHHTDGFHRQIRYGRLHETTPDFIPRPRPAFVPFTFTVGNSAHFVPLKHA